MVTTTPLISPTDRDMMLIDFSTTDHGLGVCSHRWQMGWHVPLTRSKFSRQIRSELLVWFEPVSILSPSPLLSVHTCNKMWNALHLTYSLQGQATYLVCLKTLEVDCNLEAYSQNRSAVLVSTPPCSRQCWCGCSLAWRAAKYFHHCNRREGINTGKWKELLPLDIVG